MTPNNNNNFIQKIREILSGISLTTDEKKSIRRQLEQTMTETSSVEVSRQQPSWIHQLQQLPRFFGTAAVGFATVLFMLGGLTYAAEDALPGTPLYGVKKHVNEAFINLTSVSDSKTAATQSKLAARRINELQALINKGKLTTTTSEELLRDIAAHTKVARENIANLEAAGDKKRRQAVELRSQLTALLAAESESLESATSGTSSASSTDNKLARDAARKLIAIAEGDTDTATSTSDDKLTQSALTDLLELTVNRLDETYQQYQMKHDTDTTPPPQELVTAAHDLETALKQIRNADYTPAVGKLQSLLVQLDDVRSSLSNTTSSSAISKTPGSSTKPTGQMPTSTATSTDSDGMQVANKPSASSTQETDTATSTQPTSSTPKTPKVTTSIPSKQNLHNQTIQEIITEVKSYLDDTRKEAERKKQATTTASSTAKQTNDAAASSTASSTNQQAAETGTSSASATTSDSGSQQGDESRL